MEIELKNVWVSLHQQEILQDISLSLLPKGMTMLLGRNGAGKTTLFRTILGQHQPSGGQVLLEGRSISSWSHKERSRKIAYIPQEKEMPIGCTVLEYVAMGQAPYTPFYKSYDREGLQMGKQALEELGISSLLHRQMVALSGGEKKLVAIARTRVQKTPWMILDEPLAALDFTRQHEILQKLRQESRRGKGVLLSIHDPSLAVQYADRILLLHEKQIAGDFVRGVDGFSSDLEQSLQKIYGKEVVLLEEGGQKILYWKEE